MGDTSDREIGGAGPALCVKPAKEEAKLGSPPPPLAGCRARVLPVSLAPGPDLWPVLPEPEPEPAAERPGSLPCVGDRQCPGS